VRPLESASFIGFVGGGTGDLAVFSTAVFFDKFTTTATKLRPDDDGFMDKREELETATATGRENGYDGKRKRFVRFY
jgi:hypothetical protein